MKKIMLTLIFALPLAVWSQQLYPCGSEVSFWTFEQDSAYYAVKLFGTVEEQGRKNVLSVNSYALQYLVVDKKRYVISDTVQSDDEILTRYVLSEAEYMSGLFKQKLAISMQHAQTSADKSVLIWSFEMPTAVSREVKHQVFVNVIMDDKIVGFSSSQFENQELEDVKTFLMNVISTLQQLDSRKDFDKLCDENTDYIIKLKQ